MPNSFAHMAEYASQCYMTDIANAGTIVTMDDPKPTPHSPPTTITKRVLPKSPKKTHLDIQVFYVNDARVVYIRGKHRLGPMLSHMHESDIVKILSLYPKPKQVLEQRNEIYALQDFMEFR